MATSTIKQHIEGLAIKAVSSAYSVSANGQSDFNINVANSVSGYAHWDVIGATAGKASAIVPNYYPSGNSVIGTVKNLSSGTLTGTVVVKLLCWK